jgi:hypothetical protein
VTVFVVTDRLIGGRVESYAFETFADACANRAEFEATFGRMADGEERFAVQEVTVKGAWNVDDWLSSLVPSGE